MNTDDYANKDENFEGQRVAKVQNFEHRCVLSVLPQSNQEYEQTIHCTCSNGLTLAEGFIFCHCLGSVQPGITVTQVLVHRSSHNKQSSLS